MKNNTVGGIIRIVCSLVIVLFSSAPIYAQTVGIPHPAKNYTQSVEQWWSTHPYNSQTSANNYIPVGGIADPTPTVNVCNYKAGSDTAGIKEALAALPASGGTLYFDPACSPYIMTSPLVWSKNIYGADFADGGGANIEILARSNLHFISDGAGATVTGTWHITSYAFRNQGGKINPVRNYYFKNLTFNSNTGVTQVFSFEDVEDVLFDNDTFDGTGYWSVVQGNNIFVRNSKFLNETKTTFWNDGVQFSGILNSQLTISGTGNWPIDFHDNQDATWDGDKNGQLDIYEERLPKYYVAQGNTFRTGSSSQFVVVGSIGNFLFRNNTVTGPGATTIRIEPDTRPYVGTQYYDYYDYVIDSNSIANYNSVFGFWSGGSVNKGKATISNNTLTSVPTIYDTSHVGGTVTGPIVVCGNTVNGQRVDGNCSFGSTPIPTASPTRTPSPIPSRSPTPLPSASPTPQPPVTTPDGLYYGVFEDGQLQTDNTTFTNTINDLKNHNMDSILFTNTQPDLATSDNLNFHVIAAPMSSLYANFYKSTQTVTLDQARTLLYPVVDSLKNHSSLVGYNIHDDAIPGDNQKMAMIKQVFEERDQNHSTTPLLIFGPLAQEVYDFVKPKTFMGYDFPFKANTTACQVDRGTKDWIYELRESFQLKPPSDPLWLVLQAHKTIQGDSDPTNSSGLRQPSPEEISLQHWEALGEEAKGIFWYTYSTSPFPQDGQYWVGLKDLPAQYAMVTSLAGSFRMLKPVLSSTQKIPDRFTVSGSNYVSTLQDKTNGIYYIIAVNQSCAQQNLTITSDYLSGTLRDMLTGTTYALGSPIPFSGGGGKLFQLVNGTAKNPPAMQANLVVNPSFESISSGKPSSWLTTDLIASDTTVKHSGNASVKIGPTGSLAYQNINLTPNTYYYLSYWIKTQNLDNSVQGMRVVQTTPSVVYLTTPNWHATGSQDWTKRVGFFKTPSNTDRSRIDIVWGLTAGQVFWVDDVTLCKMGQPCPDEYLAERLTSNPSPSIPPKPGDSNGDSMVDGLDYVAWLGHYGQAVSGASNGDFDNNGKVDGLDYVMWLNNYGH